MSILNRIFGKKSTNNTSTVGNSASINGFDHLPEVDESIFVDNNPPQNSEMKADNSVGIQDFLAIDFFHMGYDDGYNWHSNEMLITKLQFIKADFRQRLDMKADEVRREILGLENKKLEIIGLLDHLESRIDNITAEKRYILQKIRTEKELSAVDEGLVMTCVHRYKEGFLKGTNAHMEEEMFASNKGLFN